MASPAVPIRFQPVAVVDSRPQVRFQEDRGDAEPGAEVTQLPFGGCITVQGKSSGGWVFCGLGEDGTGDYTSATGATIEELEGFSGDESSVKFKVLHDGASQQVLVTYNTRAD